MRKTKAQRDLEKSCTTFMGMHTDPENVRGLIDPRWFGGKDDPRYDEAIKALVEAVKDVVKNIFVLESIKPQCPDDLLPQVKESERVAWTAMLKSSLKDAGLRILRKNGLADGWNEYECRAQFAHRLNEMP